MARQSRRAQAALEFLTTYGWAVLIILVMVGAITYFGVLRPNKFLPSKCVVSSEFNCDDFQIQSNVVRFQLKQGLGKSIIWQNSSCIFDDPVAGRQNITATPVTIGGIAAASGSTWSPRNAALITCTFPVGTLDNFRDEKGKVYFNVSYLIAAGGLTRTAEGEIFTEVQ